MRKSKINLRISCSTSGVVQKSKLILRFPCSTLARCVKIKNKSVNDLFYISRLCENQKYIFAFLYSRSLIVRKSKNKSASDSLSHKRVVRKSKINLRFPCPTFIARCTKINLKINLRISCSTLARCAKIEEKSKYSLF